MGDIQLKETASARDLDSVSIKDLMALLRDRATGQGSDRDEQASSSLQNDYVKLDTLSSSGGGRIKPDSPPKDIEVGAINPYALVEALLGRNINKCSTDSAKILSSVLQTDYDELFDMKHNSVLFTGLQLNEKDRMAQKLSSKDMKILSEKDLMTPDLSDVRKLEDLERLGLKDVKNCRIKCARMQNGKLHLVLHAHQLGQRITNREVTMSVNELASPFRMNKGHWTPPNGAWRDMYDQIFQSVNKRLIGDLQMYHINENSQAVNFHNFDDPIQGCASNSYFVAALFSVFWADPHCINRATRVHQDKDQKKRLCVKFYDQGGHNNAKTENVEVNYEIPINNSNNEPMYCRSSNKADIWPSLYEKAFAKWISGSSHDQPDITQIASGDPVKAMAQINGKHPHYFSTQNHSACEMLALVRHNCLNFKTINPMTAWTYATGKMYRGSNLVANHAYSVLGYAVLGDEQYIVLRNPWGVSEPIGLNSYPGMLERLNPELWHPASLLDHGGLFAMEVEAFKHCFNYVGVAC